MASQKVIQSRFAKKSETYTTYAKAQQEAARLLLQLQREELPEINGTWLDIGSGPSILSSLSETTPVLQKAINLDISLDSLLAGDSEKRQEAVLADMDSLPFRKESLHGILSSSALQWSQNIKQLLRSVHTILHRRGYALISILGEKTLTELRGLQKKYKIKTFTSYYEEEYFLKLAQSCGFSLLRSSSINIPISYKSSKEALLSISKIGAATHRTHLLNTKELSQFQRDYAQLFPGGEILHNYEYHFFLLQKREL